MAWSCGSGDEAEGVDDVEEVLEKLSDEFGSSGKCCEAAAARRCSGSVEDVDEGFEASRESTDD